ncbi:MAG: hypothetical protein AAFY91_17035, partial [Bacteroidota bacterium]
MSKKLNPFIQIHLLPRLFVWTYFLVVVVWGSFYPVFLQDAINSLEFKTCLLRFFSSLMLFAPVLFPSKSLGYIHPLIFPTLLGILKSIATRPLSAVLSLNKGDVYLLSSTAIDVSPETLLYLNFKFEILDLIWVST